MLSTVKYVPQFCIVHRPYDTLYAPPLHTTQQPNKCNNINCHTQIQKLVQRQTQIGCVNTALIQIMKRYPVLCLVIIMVAKVEHDSVLFATNIACTQQYTKRQS